MKKLFTSESVSRGHPDKVCDQIADAILDACLEIDENAHVACECFICEKTLVIGGQITVNGEVDYVKIAKDVLKEIGYDEDYKGFNYKTASIINLINKQSPDIAMGVDKEDQGAGDQGIMFGYASNETKEYMPLAISLANQLIIKADELLRDGTFKYALNDMKSQVTIDYTNQNPKVDTVLMSIQHKEETNLDEFKEFVKENIILKVLKDNNLNIDCNILINPTGRFVIGGPQGDTGLTGRKLIVDTYGGYSRHGGGSFSGKDASKVDRSATYACRYVAKNLVAAGYADKLEVQLSYAIGISKPISVSVNTFNTNKVSEDLILKAISKYFDLTPKGIITKLDLKKPVFYKTSYFGHFGRNIFSWEKLDLVEELIKFRKENA